MTDFKPGETVVGETGTEYEVMFGPYESFGAAHYLVKSPTGSGLAIIASSLSRKSADPRREVVLRVISGAPYSMTDAELSEAILAALDAHHDREVFRTADPARYRDRDGDVWEERTDGVLTLAEANDPETDPAVVGLFTDAMNDVSREYGPLTRI